MDLRLVRKLLNLMETHGLIEVEIEEEGSKVRLRKEGAEPKAHPTPVMTPIVQAHPSGSQMHNAQQPADAAPGGGAAAPEVADGLLVIKSPMVGTFYRASSPESEPFVSVGDEVQEDTTVCIIEAMKVMNEIKSETNGEIAAVLAENGEAVEFGQPLFKVKPSQSG